MSPNDLVRLRHMADAIQAAKNFTAERSRSDLEHDQMLTFALVRAIEIVGEAAARLSPEAKSELPGVPWNEIVGMRNRLVHAYFDTNLDILWTTATSALPKLLEGIKSALPDD
jgi:uncharacterized protein with HEPN domain